MRHSTWLKLESSPVWHPAYRLYRRMPSAWRAPVRWMLLPHWSIMTGLVQALAARRVLRGPFAGMTLRLSGRSARLLSSYILGTFELEIQTAIEQLIARGYATVVNVGAADGYYAAGFARRLPEAEVLAFEAIGELHPIIRQTAAANGVADRVRISPNCDLHALQIALAHATAPMLLFVDVEGYEAQLLDPDRLPALRSVDFLIETHEAAVPGCTELLVGRFRASHAIERFVARPRELRDFPSGFLPFLPKLFPSAAVELMNERRTGIQQWLYCQARPSGPSLEQRAEAPHIEMAGTKAAK
jgi:hypothetical protein